MRGLFVGVVGALAILASAAGLALDGLRPGPHDRALEPVAVPLQHEATWSIGSSAPLGVCLTPPCPTTRDVEARLEGVPPVPYEVRVQGPSDAVGLGTFEPVGGVLEVVWHDDGGDGDKDRFVFAVAGRDVGALPFDGLSFLVLSWEAAPDRVHVGEIGAVTVSTVATAVLDETAPEGWEFRARFEGSGGPVDLGALEPAGDGQVALDGRAERVRLGDQQTLTIVVAPVGSGGDAGFPVLRAEIWPED